MSPEPTAEEQAQWQREANLKKYGLKKTDNEVIAALINIACEMGKELEAESLLHHLSKDTYNWYVNHKKRDDALKKEELAKQLNSLTAKYTAKFEETETLREELAKIKEQLRLL